MAKCLWPVLVPTFFQKCLVLCSALLTPVFLQILLVFSYHFVIQFYCCFPNEIKYHEKKNEKTLSNSCLKKGKCFVFVKKSQTLYRLYYVVKKLLLICVWKKYGKILLEVIVKISTYKILFRHPDEMSEDELSSPLYTGINPPRLLLWCGWYGGGWWSVTATASSLMTVASDVAL